MPYPEHLLPKENYQKIAWATSLCAHFLLRTTPESDLIDQETGLVRDKFITTGSREQLKDFSTNLFGTFTEPDASLEWVKGERKSYYASEWQEGESVIAPSEDDYISREEYGFFFYSVGVLHDYPQPIAIPKLHPHTQAKCYVCHTPVKGNFWHFSVRWKIGQDDIEIVLTEKERRDLLSMVKTFLKNNAIVDSNAVQKLPIPANFYQQT